MSSMAKWHAEHKTILLLGMQSQPPAANGQLSGLTKDERGGESLAFDLDDFPSLSTRPTSGGSGALQGVAGKLSGSTADDVARRSFTVLLS